jgi:RNase P/RNase MRP subunit p30
VLPRVEDENSSRTLSEVLTVAGYTNVGLTLPTGLMRDRVKKLSCIFREQGIETALRADLTSTNRADLLRLLRRFRSSYDIISVKCMNANVATVACRDRRVDVIFFDSVNPRVRFNHSFANVLRGTFELNLSSIFTAKNQDLVLSRIAKEASVARQHGTSVVLSSGCTSPSMVRSPSQVASIASMLGLSAEQSRLGSTVVPYSIIEHNIFRRSSEYVEEGVRIILPRIG